MPKRYSSDQIIAVLIEKGFRETNQTGSHKKFRRDNRIVIVPHPRKIIPAGTFGSILKQAGLTAIDFESKH